MQTLPTPEEALAALKSQPGIDLTKQKKGTRIIVETDSLLFEIVVLDPARCLIEVASTTPLLREPTIGQYLRGVYVLDASVGIDHWIGRTMQMFLHFRNGDFLTGPVVTASIAGPGWTYDVF
jgi:hypothetical protein